MSLKKEVTTPTSPLFPNYLWLTSILRLTCLVLSGVWLIFGKCTNSGFIVPDLYFFGTGSVGSSNITGNGWNVFANHCQQWQDLRPVWTEVVLRSWRCKYGMTGYLWFIGLSMVFCYQCYISNMISTVCIYIYIVAYIQTVPGCFSCAQEAPPRHATSLVSVVSEVQDLYLSCRFFGVKTTHMSWWHGKKGTIFEVHEVSKSRECIT